MNYDSYSLTAREWLCIFGEYIIIILLISYLFYDSYFSLIFLSPLFIVFVKWKKGRKCKEGKDELEKEFLKSLQSVTTSLAAGYSPENAFIEARRDMEKLYGNRSAIVRELDLINGRIMAGDRIEDALFSFAQRVDSDFIDDFALIFSVAKTTGGEFVKIISSCILIMQQAHNTEEEMKVLIRGKQYEQRIMSIVPFGIIFYLRISSGSFISVLYHNYFGIIVMSICLIIYVVAIFISEKICEIDL